VTGSRVRSCPCHLQLRDQQARYRLAFQVALELQLGDVIGILGFLTLSPLASERVDLISERSHSSSDSCLELSLDIFDLVPRYGLEIKEPKLIEKLFFRI
jgi:hypothetical protein